MNSTAGSPKRKMLFIGLDGFAYKQFAILDPPLKGITLLKAHTGGEDAKPETIQDTVSGPGWASLFTGVWHNKNGIDSNCIKKPSKVPTLYHYLKQNTECKTSLSYKWSVLFDIFPEKDKSQIDTAQLEDEEEHHVTNAIKQIESGADAVCVVFDDVDEAGHAYGWSEEYDAQCNKTIGFARQIIEAVEKREKEQNESWLVILAADHGREPKQGFSHGGHTECERLSFLGIRVTEDVVLSEASKDEDRYVTSLLPTFLTHMGRKFNPEDFEGPSMVKGH